jgi:hypothetical protein
VLDQNPAFVKKHTAWIADRGGKRRIFTPVDLTLVRWHRVRDDISEATITVQAGVDSPQADQLRAIEAGRHELVLFRENERVWEGPITLITYGRNNVEIHAKDIVHYLSRTVMHAPYSSAYPNIEYSTSRLKRIIDAEVARKEALGYNILSHVVEHHTASDAQTSRITDPYQLTVFEHLDDMAAKAGVDYVTVGRALHIWDTDKPAMGQTAQVTESDFIGDAYVSVYGMELATRYIVTDGQGGFGIAGGVDDYYGEVELLATAYDEEKDEEVPSTAELTSQAQRNINGRNPTPLMVRIADNSSLNPDGVLTVADLVPGVHMPLLLNLGIRQISQMQKLDKVTFEETSKGETIGVTLSPAAHNDDEEGDE